jgi:hypothetical protein
MSDDYIRIREEWRRKISRGVLGLEPEAAGLREKGTEPDWKSGSVPLFELF